ncbi:MAG: hypothetical protein Q7W05_04215 [Deltaproteobacteria bacterium]|nr:hypothetical protein [Deltaproteobacteria bacterium]
MKDQQVWEQGLIHVGKRFASLVPHKKQQLMDLIAEYRQGKEALTEILTSLDSEAVCCDCGGKCCFNGKYRLNVFDVLALYSSGIQISADFEKKPLCPYGTCQGCIMEPGLRPADCVLFVCDLLDERLSVAAKSSVISLEITIRKCLQRASLVMGEPLEMALLLWSEKLKDE